MTPSGTCSYVLALLACFVIGLVVSCAVAILGFLMTPTPNTTGLIDAYLANRYGASPPQAEITRLSTSLFSRTEVTLDDVIDGDNGRFPLSEAVSSVARIQTGFPIGCIIGTARGHEIADITKYRFRVLPFGLFIDGSVFALVFVGGMLLARHVRGGWRIRHLACPNCGYPLLDGRCAECGFRNVQP